MDLDKVNWRISRFPILASTNDLALDWMRSGKARVGDVLVTEEQLSGRGRRGRTWHSPKGALLMTAVLPFHAERVGWTSLAAGVAVASAVCDLGAAAGVKWPNDVLLGGGKLAGILAETSVPRLVAVGIGMNVSNPLPAEPGLAARSARLADFLPDVTPDQVLDAVLKRLLEFWEYLGSPDIRCLREAWSNLDTTAGRRLCWSEEGIRGVAEGVDEHGALQLRTDGGRIETARVGEVTFL